VSTENQASRKLNIKSLKKTDQGEEKAHDFRLIDFPLTDAESREKLKMFCKLLKET
jgi:hypothetical protein